MSRTPLTHRRPAGWRRQSILGAQDHIETVHQRQCQRATSAAIALDVLDLRFESDRAE